jgi:hypothetical protein
MKLSIRFLCAALALLALGCATAYQPRGFKGGFEETKLGDSVYKVSFPVNSFTSSSAAEKLLLRRCAELTLEHGFRYFSFSEEGRLRATIKFLPSENDAPVAVDAITVVEETNSAADGRLSAKAQAALEKLKADLQGSGS